jgi:signal transduction histidine kinase
MYEAAECMVAAMDEMTDSARLHSGQPLVLQLGLVEVGALVSGVAHALNETRVWCRTAPIAVVGSPEAVLVGDRTRLQRVLRTVLDYVAARSRAEAPVQVTVRPQGDAVTIAVQEADGPLPAQERGPAAGAGLDAELATARRIVEQHGGHLRLAQARGQDAPARTVILSLPRSHAWHDGATGAHRRRPRAAS